MLVNPYRFAAGGGGGGDSDPDFASVVALVHVEDTIEQIVAGITGTLIGDAVISTDQAKFGSKSINNNGTSAEGTDGFELSAAGDGFVFTGDFTLELWVYLTSTPSEFCNLISTRSLGAGGFQIAINANAIWWNGDGAITHQDSAIVTGVWNHFAACRSGSTLRFFVNGVLLSSMTVSSSGAVGKQVSGTSYLCFGGGNAPLAGDNGDIRGYYEEIRITAAARYTADFTPPTSPFPDSA